MAKSNKDILVYDSTDIQKKIFSIRYEQVMLDSDLAQFYGVETKYLNRAVKRNSDRFPKEFMFQLNDDEWDSLRFQIGTSNEEDSLRFPNGTLKDKAVFLRSQNATLDEGIVICDTITINE